jgi:CheY-like chemotaxis protein
MGSVLLIEDDEDIRDVFGEALRAAGHEVVVAATGRQGLRHLRTTPHAPGVLLLDLMLPDMNGAELVAEVRQDPRWAELPVVVISASGKMARARIGIDVAAVLMKPVELDDLLSTVARFCAAAPLRPIVIDPVERNAGYLARRRVELVELESLFSRGVHGELRRIGHNLMGTGASFGFPELGTIGAKLEKASAAANIGAERGALDELGDFLRRADSAPG